MESNKNISDGFTIKQSSEFLGLSTKTIYNYINKKLLDAHKWNGIWMVDNRSIMELHLTMNRIKTESSVSIRAQEKAHESSFWVDKRHYEELLRKSGQLQAAEDLLKEYKSENQRLLSQVGELEMVTQRLEQERQRRGILGRFRRGARKGGSRTAV